MLLEDGVRERREGLAGSGLSCRCPQGPSPPLQLSPRAPFWKPQLVRVALLLHVANNRVLIKYIGDWMLAILPESDQLTCVVATETEEDRGGRRWDRTDQEAEAVLQGDGGRQNTDPLQCFWRGLFSLYQVGALRTMPS